MRLTAHKHAFCHDCGYCLFGQADRCPECGQTFDPRNPVSYSGPPVAIGVHLRAVFDRWGWVVCAMAALLIGFALIIVAGMLA